MRIDNQAVADFPMNVAVKTRVLGRLANLVGYSLIAPDISRVLRGHLTCPRFAMGSGDPQLAQIQTRVVRVL